MAIALLICTSLAYAASILSFPWYVPTCTDILDYAGKGLKLKIHGSMGECLVKTVVDMGFGSGSVRY
ncbi:hypothetical protein BT63DRAFT_111908 [Microthyrium microscopicum]|uniref:Uncharacterized protein n=1 Tax=Microthyrium microscopicum TaxID=703497 RepID=A0A6A6TYM3_9PEZI|nr:hypothetical protein BT63DRAFT_111908 [Microthyrium microscopicum]